MAQAGMRRLKLVLLIVAMTSASCMLAPEPWPVITEPAREFSGVWLDVFEGSPFLEGATEAPGSIPEKQYFQAWLKIDPKSVGVAEVPNGVFDCYPVTAVRLKFIGRRSVRPDPRMNGFGHGGVAQSEISVDRVISFEKIPGPRCEPEVIWAGGRRY